MTYDSRYVYDKRLIVEDGFWDQTPEELAGAGCGSQAAHIDLVPDCILGADVWLACAAHDYAYSLALDKRRADIAFMHNILVLCDTNRDFIFLSRARIAMMYFEAVVGFGNASFGMGQ